MYHFKQKKFYNADLLKLNDNIIARKEITKYLTDFQFEAIRFLYKNFQNHQSCILNDESGLGKTATVCTFLDTVLPADQNKRILILVKNENRILNWKFHLSMFVRKDFSQGISIKEWDSLRDSSFINLEYDCIIIDDRDDLISNKICLAYLLRNFEKKVSLIVSSKDVTTNLKLFHSTLRLIGRLEQPNINFKYFEEKFSLPDLEGNPGDLNVLEKYFMRREKIIEICRDFRLRRLCEQFKSELPLVDRKVYEHNVEKWKNDQKHNNSSNFFTTVYKYSSSTISKSVLQNCDIFSEVEEDEFNAEVSKLTTLADNKAHEMELLPMSPLLFESDSEETRGAVAHQTKVKNRTISLKKNKKNDLNNKTMTLRNKKINSKNNQKNENSTNLQIKTRGMERVTRSQAKKSKYLLLDMDKTIKRGNKVSEIQKKKKINDLKDSNVKTNHKLNQNHKVANSKHKSQTKTNNSIGSKRKVNTELSGIISNDPKYALDIVYPTCSEVVVVSPPNDDTIIISGSSASSDLVIDNINKYKNVANNFNQKSPECSFDEFNITCAQKPALNKLNRSSEFGVTKSFKKNKITNYLSQELFTKSMITEYAKTPKKDYIYKTNKSKCSPISANLRTPNSTLTKWFKKSNNPNVVADVYQNVKRRQLNY